jgi:hypothetical protein
MALDGLEGSSHEGGYKGSRRSRAGMDEPESYRPGVMRGGGTQISFTPIGHATLDADPKDLRSGRFRSLVQESNLEQLRSI